MDGTKAFTEILANIPGFLGIIGALINFIFAFIPGQESAEISLMKEKFAEINSKLNGITNQLNDMENLITLETQRAVYVRDAHKILYGHKQFHKFLKELDKVKCKSKKECRRSRIRIAERYLDDFKIQESLSLIMTGTTRRTVFGDPLLQLIQTTYKCDVAKINRFSGGVFQLAFKVSSLIKVIYLNALHV